MSIQFAESHVDLMGSVTFTSQQLANRWEWELEKKWNRVTQDNLRDFMQIKPALDPETFPGYAQSSALLAEFIADKSLCYERRLADEVRSDLLVQILAYEQAVRDAELLSLQINGQEGQQAVVDPITQEVLVEAIEPVAAMAIEDERYQGCIEALEAAQAVMAAAPDQVKELADERAGGSRCPRLST